MALKKIKVRKTTTTIVSSATIAEGLGAKIINIPKISRKEAQQYQPLGIPFMISDNDPSLIYNIGSKMLNMYGKSLEDVVGYRILGADEELRFRRQCEHRHSIVVRYYTNKE